MTTNSPNPVDGDVQALIKDCQRDIEKLEKSLASNNDHPMSFSEKHLRSELARQQVALAALTAEPVGFCFKSDLDLMLNKIMISGMMTVRYSGEHPLYTTPPAQLLRPVELPKPIQQTESSDYGLEPRDSYGLYWGSVETLKLVAESLRQQGYEVKS